MKLSNYLIPNETRIKPEEANKMKLARIRKINFDGEIFLDDITKTNTDMIVVNPGNLVISGINADKGAISIYKGDKPSLASIHYSSYDINEGISIEYLRSFFKSPKFIKSITKSSGIKTELKSKHILKLNADLPSYEQQKLIAQKIDVLLQWKNQIELEVDKYKKNISDLKRIIYKKSFSGDLTKKFRINKNLNIDDLIKNLKKNFKIKNIENFVLNTGSYKIPSNWKWVKLSLLIELTSGQHIFPEDQNKNSKGTPYLTGPSDFGEKFPIVSRWATKGKTYAIKNDILIGVKGSVGKLNFCDLEKAYLGRQLMSIRTKLVNREYIYKFLESKYDFFNSMSKSQIPGIKRDTILNLEIPLPSVIEQNEIVKELNYLFEFLRVIEDEMQKLEIIVEKLQEIILRKFIN